MTLRKAFDIGGPGGDETVHAISCGTCKRVHVVCEHVAAAVDCVRVVERDDPRQLELYGTDLREEIREAFKIPGPVHTIDSIKRIEEPVGGSAAAVQPQQMHALESLGRGEKD